MKMGKNGVNPYHTEHTGAQDHDDRWRETLSDTAAGCDGTVHEGTDGIGEAHNPCALESCFDDRLVICEQGEKFSAEQ